MPVGKIFDLQKGDVPSSATVQPFDPNRDSSATPNAATAGKVPRERFDTFLSDINSTGTPVP